MRLAADNLHALNPVVADALRNLDPGPLQELARRCELPGCLPDHSTLHRLNE